MMMMHPIYLFCKGIERLQGVASLLQGAHRAFDPLLHPLFRQALFAP